ncbi:MAG: N-acetyltransferase [Burkholderiales bacterium]|nr:N-acetyltransferase [Burkholderiales bacterium]
MAADVSRRGAAHGGGALRLPPLRTVRVRRARPADAEAIRAIHLAAFPTDAEAWLVERLRAKGRLCLSLVAQVGRGIAGHVAFSRVRGGAAGLGLAPLAVAPAWQRRGIGGRLVRDGLALCARMGYRYAVVLGDPAYYRRFGFVPGTRYGLANEYGAGDPFMVIALAPDGLPRPGTLVRFGLEFAAAVRREGRGR